MILGIGQLGDTDSVASKHFGRNLGRIVTGAQNDDFGARYPAQETFKIAVGRDQDETDREGVPENSEIAYTSKPVSKRTF